MAKRQPTYLVCVNEKPHSKTALHFACAKAAKTNSKVLMLYVVDPVDYNALFSVADVIKEERIADAEKLLKKYAKGASKWGDVVPEYAIREGFVKDEAIACIEENKAINLLILGVAADGSSHKGKLLSQLTEEIGVSVHVPLMIVPGNMTNKKIDMLTGHDA